MRLRLERQAIYNILTHSPQKGKCIFCAPKFGTFILEIPHCGALTLKDVRALCVYPADCFGRLRDRMAFVLQD